MNESTWKKTNRKTRENENGETRNEKRDANALHNHDAKENDKKRRNIYIAYIHIQDIVLHRTVEMK